MQAGLLQEKDEIQVDGCAGTVVSTLWLSRRWVVVVWVCELHGRRHSEVFHGSAQVPGRRAPALVVAA